MFDSLRSRLILILLGLLTLMTVAMGYAGLSAMKRDSELQARQALKVASRVFRETLSHRALQLGDSVRLVASDFGFRQAVALREQDTIASVLENHGSRINASLTVLLSPDGELIAGSGQPVSRSQLNQLFRDMHQADQGSVSEIVHVGNQAFQMVMVPVKAPQLIAWIAMGFVLDQALASQIKDLTDLDISFVLQADNSQGRLLASTLTGDQIPQLPLLRTADQDLAEVPLLSSEEILDESGQLSALLHLSTEPWLQNYRQARGQLLAICGLGLALAVLMAIVLARSITEPLRLLTDFAGAIGLGQSARPPQQLRGEVGVLADTLQKMQSDIAQREQQMMYQSQHDALTSLANRHLVELQLPALLGHPLWLLLVNIKDFKHINDAFGYHNGDELLVQLAGRLQRIYPQAVMVARIGGDEFLVISSSPLPASSLPASQLRLSQDFVLADSRLNLKLALALYAVPADASSSNDALRRVDIAMVHAKASHQLWAEYQAGQDESHQRELTLLHDLPVSLQSGQMFVVYQPKVSLQSRQATSAEALIRWQHPVLGFVPPDEFIRLAEHSGLISRVTDWMVAQVILQLADWRRQGIELTVAVNLSAYDLLSSDLPGQIATLLQQHQVPPTALALEVTEGAVMQDPQQVIQNLQQLRQMGIELAIDDFGTGQSSLAYLKRLPVHEVKIDRAFVRDIEHNQNDYLIVKTTTELAHGLGLQVTAEGLENRAGLDRLQSAGIDKVQGYYFARPLKAADLTAWLGQFSQQHAELFGEET